MKRLLCVGLLVLLGGCDHNARCDPGCKMQPDSEVDASVADAADDANTPDATRDSNVADATQDAEIELVELSEQEPNGGNPIEEVNTVGVNNLVSGEITEDDADWFFFESEPGKIYRLTWLETAADWGRQFTVLDAGRGDDGPGQDYTKLLKQNAFDSLEFFSFGQGGHYVAVSSQTGQSGSYRFSLTEVSANEASGETITFPSTINHVLPTPGAIVIHPFEAAEGTDVEIRVDATELADPSEIDSRIAVYSSETSSWIMRNDDDGITVDSRVSAPLPKGGSLWLVFENIELEAPITKLDYRLTSQIN